MKRCEWPKNDLAIRYHDEEWGVPLHDDAKLFEFIVLEGAQAGLSWDTILRKRENYRRAFDGFDVKKVARYTEKKIEKLPLVDGAGRLTGLITVKDFDKSEQYPNATKDAEGRLRVGAAMGFFGDAWERAEALRDAARRTAILRAANGA